MQKMIGTVHSAPRKKRGNLPLNFSRRTMEWLVGRLMRALSLMVMLLVPLIAVTLFLRARPILALTPIGDLLFSSTWQPFQQAFGFYPFIVGTIWVTLLGMIIAVPPSLMTSIYLSEYAHPRMRSLLKPLIDLLAGIPSVVYGVWGVLIVIPFIRNFLTPLLDRWLGFIPLFHSDNPTGYSVLAGGIVLAVMVFPIIIAVAEEVIHAVPNGLREASYALGATRWQTIKHVVLRRAGAGILAAIVLGFSRAFGETMAVMMVVGNVPHIPHSILDPAYPLTALIANNYGEMMSVPLYDAALLGAALILLLVVIVFNAASRLALIRLLRNI
jgi:phosphate transport system permease protein